MAENEKTDIKEIRTEEHQKPDGIFTKKDKWKDLCNRDIFWQKEQGNISR